MPPPSAQDILRPLNGCSPNSLVWKNLWGGSFLNQTRAFSLPGITYT